MLVFNSHFVQDLGKDKRMNRMCRFVSITTKPKKNINFPLFTGYLHQQTIISHRYHPGIMDIKDLGLVSHWSSSPCIPASVSFVEKLDNIQYV
jgi:hypothetical protein